MFLGAQRALLLQIAHPQVGAGVEHHSSFRTHPILRLWGTLDTLVCLVWGSREEAEQARRLIYAVHDRVHGTIAGPDATAGTDPGVPYSAHDPALLAWVWATLVDSADAVHAAFLGPMPTSLADDLYADWCRLGRIMGIPDGALPADRAAFADRFALDLAALEVSPSARHVAEAILDPPLRSVPRPVKAQFALLAAGLLPAEVRHAYGIAWGPAEEARFRRARHRIRRTTALVPAARRDLPLLYTAFRRVTVTALAHVPAGASLPVLGRAADR